MEGVKPIKPKVEDRKQMMNQITMNKLKEEYLKKFEKRINYRENRFLQPAKVYHKEIN